VREGHMKEGGRRDQVVERNVACRRECNIFFRNYGSLCSCSGEPTRTTKIQYFDDRVFRGLYFGVPCASSRF
jgi:hypothetical protein